MLQYFQTAADWRPYINLAVDTLHRKNLHYRYIPVKGHIPVPSVKSRLQPLRSTGHIALSTQTKSRTSANNVPKHSGKARISPTTNDFTVESDHIRVPSVTRLSQ